MWYIPICSSINDYSSSTSFVGVLNSFIMSFIDGLLFYRIKDSKNN